MPERDREDEHAHCADGEAGNARAVEAGGGGVYGTVEQLVSPVDNPSGPLLTLIDILEILGRDNLPILGCKDLNVNAILRRRRVEVSLLAVAGRGLRAAVDCDEPPTPPPSAPFGWKVCG